MPGKRDSMPSPSSLRSSAESHTVRHSWPGAKRRQLLGQLQFDDVGITIGGVFVFGDGRGMRKRERDVVGGGLAEIPHDQLDHMPIRGVRLHEHSDVRSGFFGGQPTITPILLTDVNESDHAEREQGPDGPREPGT